MYLYNSLSKCLLAFLDVVFYMFYNENLTQQFSGFIDRAFKVGQKIRLKNLTAN